MPMSSTTSALQHARKKGWVGLHRSKEDEANAILRKITPPRFTFISPVPIQEHMDVPNQEHMEGSPAPLPPPSPVLVSSPGASPLPPLSVGFPGEPGIVSPPSPPARLTEVPVALSAPLSSILAAPTAEDACWAAGAAYKPTWVPSVWYRMFRKS